MIHINIVQIPKATIMDNGIKNFFMEEEFSSFEMGRYMKGLLLMGLLKVKVDIFLIMDAFMRDN